MKKVLYFIPLGLLLLAFLYLSLPFIGINIGLSELLGPTILGFKASAPQPDASSQHSLKIYAKNLNKPRFLYLTANGDLIVSEPNEGRVLLLPYNQPEKRRVLLEGLNAPHSMDVQEGYLYVAEENAIGRIAFDAQTGMIKGNYDRFIHLPEGGMHWTRTLKFGPDGYGYVSIGSSCNVCIETNPLRASIARFKPGEEKLEIFAKGLRNSVGFDWSPDGQLYATENSRDWLGDNFPPDELNLIKPNQFYGWPFANSNKVPDPKFGAGQEETIKQSIPPVFSFGAHVAPLGITFIKNPNSPWYQQAFVALHGSWNSSKKVGYKVVRLGFKDGKITQEDFITGFLKNGKVLGRPVHLVEGKYGEMYLSDDLNGVIYRIDS